MPPRGAPPEVAPETEARLLFRRGFLLHAEAAGAEGSEWRRLRAGWRCLRLADLVLWLHPEAEVAVERHGADFTVLIGEAWFVGPPRRLAPHR